MRAHPWDPARGAALSLQAIPTVAMDSHFYDYRLLSPEERTADMRRWIEEVRAVRGVAAVLWHPHTLSPDVGWADGFDQMRKVLAA